MPVHMPSLAAADAQPPVLCGVAAKQLSQDAVDCAAARTGTPYAFKCTERMHVAPRPSGVLLACCFWLAAFVGILVQPLLLHLSDTGTACWLALNSPIWHRPVDSLLYTAGRMRSTSLIGQHTLSALQEG
jgi:hypothetical protein